MAEMCHFYKQWNKPEAGHKNSIENLVCMETKAPQAHINNWMLQPEEGVYDVVSEVLEVQNHILFDITLRFRRMVALGQDREQSIFETSKSAIFALRREQNHGRTQGYHKVLIRK